MVPSHAYNFQHKHMQYANCMQMVLKYSEHLICHKLYMCIVTLETHNSEIILVICLLVSCKVTYIGL